MLSPDSYPDQKQKMKWNESQETKKDSKKRFEESSGKPVKQKNCWREKHDLQLLITTRRLQQMLSSCSHIEFRQAIKAPYLLKRHKKSRIDWTKEHFEWHKVNWNKVLFLTTKNLSLMVLIALHATGKTSGHQTKLFFVANKEGNMS